MNKIHINKISEINRDKLINYLFDNKIETLIHYPIPPHLQNAYKDEMRALIKEAIREIRKIVGSTVCKVGIPKVCYSFFSFSKQNCKTSKTKN